MTVRTSGDNVPSTDGDVRPSADRRYPPPSTEPGKSDALRGDGAVEGDRPLLVAGDTSGVARSALPVATERPDSGELESLFRPDAATDFRARWDVVQRSFVDDPQQAVRAGDELVTQVIAELSQIFAEQRTQFESAQSEDHSSTETLRLALRRYRSFFERLLTV